MKITQDAYGQQLLAQHNSRTATVEIIERDDRFIATGSEPGLYFRDYKQWSPLERARRSKQRRAGSWTSVAAPGRHSLYLQQKGFDVTGIDISPGAVKVCRLRGLKKVLVTPITGVDKFKPNSFDTILMLGNNFGLFGSEKGAKLRLKKLYRISSPDARIIAGTRNPYKTDNPNHLQYLRLNKKRGRMPGQIRIRVRFEKTVGPWFDYLFVSPEEMEDILSDTGWLVEGFIGAEEPNYFAVIRKK